MTATSTSSLLNADALSNHRSVPWNETCCNRPILSLFGKHRSRAISLTKDSNGKLEAWHATGSKLHCIKASEIPDAYLNRPHFKKHYSTTQRLDIDGTSIHQVEFLGKSNSTCMAVTTGGTAAIVTRAEDPEELTVRNGLVTCKQKKKRVKIGSVVSHRISSNSAFVLTESSQLGSWHAGRGSECMMHGRLSEWCGGSPVTSSDEINWVCHSAPSPLMLWCAHKPQSKIWKLDTRSNSRTVSPLFLWEGAGCGAMTQMSENLLLISTGDKVVVFDERCPREPVTSQWQHTTLLDRSNEFPASFEELVPVKADLGPRMDFEIVVGYSKSNVFMHIHASRKEHVPGFAVESSHAKQIRHRFSRPTHEMNESDLPSYDILEHRLGGEGSFEQTSLKDLAVRTANFQRQSAQGERSPSMKGLACFDDIVKLSRPGCRDQAVTVSVQRAEVGVPLAGAVGTFWINGTSTSSSSSSSLEDGDDASNHLSRSLAIVQLTMMGDLHITKPWLEQAQEGSSHTDHGIIKHALRDPSEIQPSKRLRVKIDLPKVIDVLDEEDDEEEKYTETIKLFTRQYGDLIAAWVRAEPQTLRDLVRKVRTEQESGHKDAQLEKWLPMVLSGMHGIVCVRSRDLSQPQSQFEKIDPPGRSALSDLYCYNPLPTPSHQGDPFLRTLHELAGSSRQ